MTNDNKSDSSHKGKKGIDKINESMNKIGAMLGVKPSTSSDDSKKEPFIRPVDSDDDNTSNASAKRLLRSMNSAEGHVVGPPTMKTHSHGQDEPPTMKTHSHGEDEEATSGSVSRQEADSYTTKPTAPGKTKTAAGAAIANFAASIDNTINGISKSFRKTKEGACGGADDLEKGRRKGKVSADGSTTEYVSAEKRASMPKCVIYSIFAALAAVVAIGIVAAIEGTAINQALRDYRADVQSQQDKNLTVAFVGNSYLYVNDIPRVMEAISNHHIEQESVINTGAGLGSLLKQGNGMYELWQTPNALDIWDSLDYKLIMQEYDVEEDTTFYDWGMCTVPQLLEGYDNYLSYKNKNGAYFNTGNNPCFEEPRYMTVLNQRSRNNYHEFFDFVVLTDQTRRMADEEAREDSLDALAQAYSILIKQSRAIPIIVDTHAFNFDPDNYTRSYNNYQEQNGQEEEEASMDEEEYANSYMAEGEDKESFFGDDIPLFTSAIYAGVYEYVDLLEYALPESQKPRIAKIGMTYLAIWEDNKEMWNKLFADDSIHASPYGSYLFAVVLYCTMYEHMPKPVHEPMDVKSLFWLSRTVYGNQTLYPSVDDANYLRKWARKVQLEGYVPESMSLPTPVDYEADLANMTTNATDEYEDYDGEEGEQ